MKTREEITEMVGTVKEERIVAGKYGNAFFTENGFVIADPCYVLDDGQYARLLTQRFDSGISRSTMLSAWQPLLFDGETVYVRDTGDDGTSFFGCCVDSGWVIVMPESLYKKAQVAL